VLLRYRQHEKCLSEGFRLTTNNRMELMAVIVGLEAIKDAGKVVEVYSDSSYVVDAINKKWLDGWKMKDFKGKKNKDLWIRYLRVAAKHRITFHWIRGHAGHPENEKCDRLAVAASQQPKLLIDQEFELEQNSGKTQESIF
jgi:ribonuclease HI